MTMGSMTVGRYQNAYRTGGAERHAVEFGLIVASSSSTADIYLRLKIVFPYGSTCARRHGMQHVVGSPAAGDVRRGPRR
jgi:hypothetical protein